MLDLVSRVTVKTILGVSRQRARLIEQQKGFPRPAALIDGDENSPVWRRAAIEKYAAKRAKAGA